MRCKARRKLWRCLFHYFAAHDQSALKFNSCTEIAQVLGGEASQRLSCARLGHVTRDLAVVIHRCSHLFFVDEVGCDMRMMIDPGQKHIVYPTNF